MVADWRVIIGRAGLVSGWPFWFLRPPGQTGSLLLAGQATTPLPKYYPLPPLPTCASSEVLPYAGFPQASEIFQITLLRHAPASK